MLIPENLEETVRNLRTKDLQCQEILEKSYMLSEGYFRALESLRPSDRACVQQYHDLCEDLKERTVQLIASYYAIHGATAFVNTDL